LLLSVLFALFPLLAIVGPPRGVELQQPPPNENPVDAPAEATLTPAAAPRAQRQTRALAVEAHAPRSAPGSAGMNPAVDRSPSGNLVITVHEDGRPAADTAVEITLETSEESRVLVEHTDAHGSLRLDLPPGQARAVAWRDAAAALPAHASIRADRSAEVVLALAPAWALGGRVVDATTGRPVAGARVAVWTFAESDVVQTAADGTFLHPRFPRSAPAQQVQVQAPGYGSTVRYLRLRDDGTWKLSAATSAETSQQGSGTPWLELELIPARTVSGQVLGPDGAPLANARVSAEGFFHVMASVASRDAAEGASDAAGRFSLEGLRSDIGHALVVEAPGHARRSFELPADQPLEVDLGPLTLDPETALAGAVVDLDGQPLPDVVVVLEPVAAEPPHSAGALDVAFRLESRQRRTRTDPGGGFLFEGLAARPVRLALETSDGTRDLGEFVPRADGSFAAPTLVLEPPWMVSTGVEGH
jgi:protocatechuate 3,4-dioxygenase beta subunit